MLKQIAGILLTAGLLVGCSAGGQNMPTSTPLPQVVDKQNVIFTVERGSIASVLNITGEIVPAEQAELYFNAPGIVSRVLVNPGDKVKKGDLLAELQVDDVIRITVRHAILTAYHPPK